MLDVRFCRFGRVVGSVVRVTMSCMSVMPRRQVIPTFVVFCSFAMVPRGMFVVFGRLAMMFRSFFAHLLFSSDFGWTARS
jgi:hypothetical protein